MQSEAEDIDVFCLPLHFYHSKRWIAILSMCSKNWCIDIEKSARKHAGLLDMDILNLHALAGSDTVPMKHGNGKTKSLDRYKKHPVSSLHLPDEQLAVSESKMFVAGCYSTKNLICGESSSENMVFIILILYL